MDLLISFALQTVNADLHIILSVSLIAQSLRNWPQMFVTFWDVAVASTGSS